MRKSVFGQEKACFPGREQTETEVGGGFSEPGWVDHAPAETRISRTAPELYVSW
jgi:hypothetical protein